MLNKDINIVQNVSTTWNVRGLNLEERRDVMDHISMYGPTIVGLVETRVKESKASRITRYLPHGWSFLNQMAEYGFVGIIMSGFVHYGILLLSK